MSIRTQTSQIFRAHFFQINSFYTDPPGRAFIRQESERVLKGDNITLTCEVYPGIGNAQIHTNKSAKLKKFKFFNVPFPHTLKGALKTAGTMGGEG